MKSNRKVFLCLALCPLWLSVIGCNNNDSEPKGESLYSLQRIENIQSKEYAQIKNIPLKAKDRLDTSYQAFKERADVSNYLMTNNLINEREALELKLLENRSNLVLQQYFDNYLKEAVTADEVKRFYNENIDRYSDVSYEIQYFSLPISTSDSKEDLAKQYAEELSQKINKGDDFKAIYTAMSPNASKDNIPSASLSDKNISPALKETLSNMEIGDISMPVLLKSDYRIIKLTNRITAEKPLNEAYASVEYDLKNKLKESEYDRLLKKLAVSGR